MDFISIYYVIYVINVEIYSVFLIVICEQHIIVVLKKIHYMTNTNRYDAR